MCCLTVDLISTPQRSTMSEDQMLVSDLPDVEDVTEESMFNTADIVVFVLFVVGLIVFFFYKKYQESTTVTIKPISLQLVLKNLSHCS